jgi:hypothetical protein
MPSLEEHCQESVRLFGRPFREVHLWLDELAGQPPHGMRHRRFRHHESGVRQVEALFGPEAARAARQHIESDLRQEGWTRGDPFPRDSAHYAAMGLF